MSEAPSRSQIIKEFATEIDGKESRLDALVEQIQVYGKVVNITGSLKKQSIWKEIGEALLAYRTLQVLDLPRNNWLDIGSGGGLPGLIFGILGSDKDSFQGQLIEPRKRRVDFLSLSIIQLAIPRLSVLRGTLDEDGSLSPTPEIKHPDWVSARAVFSPEEWRRRAFQTWPQTRCMVHGRASSDSNFKLIAQGEWLDQRVELWQMETGEQS